MAANPDLAGLRALGVFATVVRVLTDSGIAVVVNNLTTATHVVLRRRPMRPLCRVRQTEEQWIRHWETVVARLADNPRVVAADLPKEVRGVWGGPCRGTGGAAVAERAGNMLLLALNPDLLIVVGGTESGNDLPCVAGRPARLRAEGRVVYAWSGWGSLGGKFAAQTYPSFVRAMRRNSAYLVESEVAPVRVGEFGAPHAPGKGRYNYWANLMRYLKAVNSRKPKGDKKESYSLVQDDLVTPVLDYWMKDSVEPMRQ